MPTIWKAMADTFGFGMWATAKTASTAAKAGAATAKLGAEASRLIEPAGRILSNPQYLKAGAVIGAGLYGFSTGETPLERVERAIGFGGLVSFGVNKENWAKLARTGKYMAAEKVGSIAEGSNIRKLIENKALRAKAIANGRIFSPGALIFGAGLTYGLINQDMNALEGAAFAGLGLTAYKAFPRSANMRKLVGARSGLTAGTFLGAMSAIKNDENPLTGAVRGAVFGTVAGGAAHALTMGYRYPLLGRMFPKAMPPMISRMEAGAGALGGLFMLGGAASLISPPVGQDMSKSANLGADGTLALGLHTLRHG